MADLINLNKVRKAKAKQRETAQAVQNRILYGISTKTRKNEKATQKDEAQRLDGKRLETDPDNKKG